MSDTPSLEEVKRMLDQMRKDSLPKPPRKINKQKNLDELLERVQLALIKACAKHGMCANIITAVLNAFQLEDIIESWSCTLVPENNCYCIRVSFWNALHGHDIYLCPEHFEKL